MDTLNFLKSDVQLELLYQPLSELEEYVVILLNNWPRVRKFDDKKAFYTTRQVFILYTKFKPLDLLTRTGFFNSFQNFVWDGFLILYTNTMSLLALLAAKGVDRDSSLMRTPSTKLFELQRETVMWLLKWKEHFKQQQQSSTD